MAQPTWDPHERRWLLEGEDAPAPRRNRRRSVDVIDRPGSDFGVRDPDERTDAPSLGAELTRVGFGARDPRPGDHDRSGRGAPERPVRSRRPADQGFPDDGSWNPLDPASPIPPSADGFDRDPYTPRRGPLHDDGAPGGERRDAPQSFAPGEFDRVWGDGLSGPATPSDDLLGPGPAWNGHGRSRHDAPGFDRGGSEPDHGGPRDGGPRDEDVARTGRDGRRSGRRGGAGLDPAEFDGDGIGRDAPARPEATGRLAAPAPGRPAPARPDENPSAAGRRPRPAPGPVGPGYEAGGVDRHGTGDIAPGGAGPDPTSRMETTGRRAAPRPGPGRGPAREGNAPGPDGYGPGQGGYGPGADGYGTDGYGPGVDGYGPGPDGSGPSRNGYGYGPGPGGFVPGRNGYAPDPDGFAGPDGYGPRPGPGRNGHSARPDSYGPGPDSYGPGPGGYAPGRTGVVPVSDGHGPEGYGRGPAGPAPDAVGPPRIGRHGSGGGRDDVPHGLGPEDFDGDGYNLDGLGRDGYGRDGFDLNGFDREGFDRDGVDQEGFDREGYPVYDPDDEPGYDPRYDDDAGYGARGYSGRGYADRGYDDSGHAGPVYDDRRHGGHGYGDGGYAEPGYENSGYDASGYDDRGYANPGYDDRGYRNRGYDDSGYQDPVYDDAAYDDPDAADEAGPDTGRNGYRTGRRRARREPALYSADPDATLTGGELPAVDEEPEEGGTRASRRTARTKRRRWPWVVGAAAVAGAVAVPVGMSLLGGSGDSSEDGSEDAPLLSQTGTAGPGTPGAAQQAPGGAAPAAAAGQVTYEVNGSGSASTITFGRGQAVAQVSGAQLPWKQESPAAQETSDYTLSAVSGDGGDISCRILVNGAVVADNKANGEYAAVSCNGRR